VSLPGDQWLPYGGQEINSGYVTKSRYRTSRADDLSAELAPAVVRERAARCERAILQMKAEIARLQPDVVVVVGDDQRELYLDDGIPTFGIFCGDELWDWPPGMSIYPPLMKDAYWAYHADHDERYTPAHELGSHVVGGLSQAGFDVTISTKQHEGRGLGHAFTFVRLRLMAEAALPMLPILINTYYPPNQPSPERCYQFGRALRASLDAWRGLTRFVLIASGGLSHPIVDESLDEKVLKALSVHDDRTLRGLDLDQLYEGNSEIRNWIIVGAALADAEFAVIDYVPGYRSLRGSGCGMGFAQWKVAGG
jgi:hypothetical protein